MTEECFDWLLMTEESFDWLLMTEESFDWLTCDGEDDCANDHDEGLKCVCVDHCGKTTCTHTHTHTHTPCLTHCSHNTRAITLHLGQHPSRGRVELGSVGMSYFVVGPLG